jgi:hypothetical protein
VTVPLSATAEKVSRTWVSLRCSLVKVCERVNRFGGVAVDTHAVWAGLRCDALGDKFDTRLRGCVGDWGASGWARRGRVRHCDSFSHFFDLHVVREVGDARQGLSACHRDLLAYGLDGGVWAVHLEACFFVCEERRDSRADASRTASR